MIRKYYKCFSGITAVVVLTITACASSDQVKTNQAETGQAEVSQIEMTPPEESQMETTRAEENKEVTTRRQPEWTKDAVIYEVNVRQYTEEGTFQAFSEHLQEIKDMGVNTLWFMPIHPISEKNRSGVLGSYYSVSDYKEINPEFGTSEDFKALVDTAHDMGFQVMIDWVANHTGWDCAWIEEHPDWYTQDENGNIISPLNMGWPDVADLNYDNAEMRTEMINCMKYWIEVYDIDGFRCDYAGGVPLDFWETAAAELEKIKPMYMLAEDWTAKELLNNAFDLNYNMKLYETMVAVAKDSKTADKIKLYIPRDYPEGTHTLNFLDNHDMNSYERTIFEAFGEESLPAMFSLVYTIPGTPLIYTGDEIALDHASAFMERDPVDWDSTDFSYRELLAELGAIRSENAALYTGIYGGEINYYDAGNKNVLAFYREKDGNVIKCLYNLSKREQTVDVTGWFDGTETVVLYGQGAEALDMEDRPVSEENLSGEVTLKPWEFWIMVGGN